MKIKFKVLATILAMTSALTSLAGTEGGGGGDAVVLPDGRVVLADVFLNHNQPQPNNMPRRISLNPVLLIQLQVYSNFLERHLKNRGFESSDILEEVKPLGERDNDIVYYAVNNVTELNTYCASGGRKAYTLPDGAAVTQVACTGGMETFIVEPIFKRMDIQHQALLLFHERLTTLRDQYGGKNYGAIAGVTAGLDKMLEIAYEQQTGKRRILAPAEVRKLELLNQAIVELEYRNKEVSPELLDWKIHPNGGGFIGSKNSVVQNDAFIDVHSYLNGKLSLQDKVEIIKSTVTGNLSMALGSRLEKSTIVGDSEIGEQTSITNSWIEASEIEIGFRVKVKDSTIHKWSSRILRGQSCSKNVDHYAFDPTCDKFRHLSRIKVEDDTTIKEAQIAATNEMTIERNSTIAKSTFLVGKLQLGRSTTIIDSAVIHVDLIAGQGLTLKSSSIIFTDDIVPHKIFPSKRELNERKELILNENQTLQSGKITNTSFSKYASRVSSPHIKFTAKTDCVDKASRIWKNRNSYHSCASTDAAFLRKAHQESVHDNSSADVEVYKNKFQILRSYSIDLSLKPKMVYDGFYTVLNGMIGPAKYKRYVEINFGTSYDSNYHGLDNILLKIKNELEGQGAKASWEQGNKEKILTVDLAQN